MAITISITEDAETPEAMADLLEHLAKMIREGYTSGYYPTWTLDGEPPAYMDGDDAEGYNAIASQITGESS